MQNINIVETNLQFNDGMMALDPAKVTQIVIHHLGNVDENGDPIDKSMTAAEIHAEHLHNGWAGIGYHYVAMPNGDVQRGRPREYIGAHTQGDNYHTIGICCSNTFMGDITPTAKMIESVALLVANLCDIYNLDIQNDTSYSIVKGHRDFMPTECPGSNLYTQLRLIAQKAIWYQQH